MEDSFASSMQRAVTDAAFRAIARRRPVPFRPPPGEPMPAYEYYVPETGGLFPFLGRVIKFTVIVTGLLFLSAITYLVFYSWIMPNQYASETLYFDYTQSCAAPVSKRAPRPPTKSSVPFALTQSRRSDHSGSAPWAWVDLFAKHSSWTAYDEHILPQPRAREHLLDPHQAYYIEAVVVLPDSSINQNAGMFGIEVELYSVNGTSLAVSRRSVRYPHTSVWIAVIGKLLTLIPILIGAVEETRSLTVASFRHFVESPTAPLQHVVVRVLASSPVEIVAGEVRIGKELNAFQELLKRWFYTCFMVGTMVFAMLYMIEWILLQELLVVIRNRYDSDYPCELDEDFDVADLPGFDLDDSNDGQEGRGGNNGQGDHDPAVVEPDDEWEDLPVRDDVSVASFATPPLF